MQYCPVCDQRMTLMSRDPDVYVCKQACDPPKPKKKRAKKKEAVEE